MTGFFYFTGLVVTFLLGIGIGYGIAVVSGHDDNPEVKKKLEGIIDKVKNIEPVQSKGKRNG